MSRVLLGTLLLVGAVVTTNVGIAQNVGPTNPPLIIRSVDGKDSFEFYCAGCHGRDGRGDGPVADRLKTKPPDLRLLAQRNGGEFPRDRVLEFVTHGDPDSREHAPADMPAWGAAFEGLDRSHVLVKSRIENIVRYLESIQLE
jgi:mono/diheme cytochrome c family protein